MGTISCLFLGTLSHTTSSKRERILRPIGSFRCPVERTQTSLSALRLFNPSVFLHIHRHRHVPILGAALSCPPQDVLRFRRKPRLVEIHYLPAAAHGSLLKVRKVRGRGGALSSGCREDGGDDGAECVNLRDGSVAKQPGSVGENLPGLAVAPVGRAMRGASARPNLQRALGESFR